MLVITTDIEKLKNLGAKITKFDNRYEMSIHFEENGQSFSFAGVWQEGADQAVLFEEYNKPLPNALYDLFEAGLIAKENKDNIFTKQLFCLVGALKAIKQKAIEEKEDFSSIKYTKQISAICEDITNNSFYTADQKESFLYIAITARNEIVNILRSKSCKKSCKKMRLYQKRWSKELIASLLGNSSAH